jgi:glycosyltransferase involved in cell wall biosynthesis
MEPDRGVDDLISAVALLRASGLTLELVIAGREHPETPLPSETWVHYLGNLAFNDVPWAFAAVDVVAIPYRRSVFMDAGASNKIGEALACARPLSATASPNLTDNFPEAAHTLANYLATPGDAPDLARVLAAQIARPRLVPLPNAMTFEAVAAMAKADLGRLSVGTACEPDENRK